MSKARYDGLRTRSDVELVEDLREMGLHRPDADEEARRDSRIAHATRGEAKHVPLAVGKGRLVAG